MQRVSELFITFFKHVIYFIIPNLSYKKNFIQLETLWRYKINCGIFFMIAGIFDTWQLAFSFFPIYVNASNTHPALSQVSALVRI